MRTLTLILPDGLMRIELFEVIAKRLETFSRTYHGRPLRDGIDRHLAAAGLISCHHKHKGRFVWHANDLGRLCLHLFRAFAA